MDNKSTFKQSLIIFFQIIIVLIGIGALAFMLWEPHIEGRNVNATNFEIYFKDPFLAYAYVASIPFFIALYRAFKVLGYVRQNQVVSQESVKALRTIRYCALAIIGFVVPTVAYLFIVRPDDDIAGGVFIGVLITFISIIIAAVAAMFQRRIQDANDIKA